MSSRPDDICPECGEALLYDEVDIGVGIQYSTPRPRMVSAANVNRPAPVEGLAHTSPQGGS